MAARMAKSLQNRTFAPAKYALLIFSVLCIYMYFNFRFIVDVNERIEMVRKSSEVFDREHEDHVIFRQEQDEQLLLWMQR